MLLAAICPARSHSALATHVNTQPSRSADEHGGVGEKLVLGDLQVERGRALARAPRCIVVAAMAGAEPPVVIARVWQGHAACRVANTSDTAACIQGLNFP